MTANPTEPLALLRNLAHHELIPELQRLTGDTSPSALPFTIRTDRDDTSLKTAETAALILVQTTAADQVIYRGDRPYLLRRFLHPRDEKPQRAYLHHIRYDDEHDPHDHPWPSLGWLLHGALIEQWWDTPHAACTAPCTGSVRLVPGAKVLRPPYHIHRLVLPDGVPEAITMFVTGAKCRDWGFWTPTGFIAWNDYTSTLAHKETEQ